MTTTLEYLLPVAAVLAVLLMIRRGRTASFPWRIMLVALALTGLGMAVRGGRLRRETASVQDLAARLPRQTAEQGYVTSDTCRSCHPAQFESWHDSYHRTMTQKAVPGAVIGNFDNVSLYTWGHEYFLFRKGGEYWVRTDDPDWRADGVTTGVQEYRILMTTGAHHYQVYWVEGGPGRPMINLPFVFLTDRRQWTPREFVFVTPPPLHRQRGFWNQNCIRCHTTGAMPGLALDGTVLDTRIGELGISCEACHGPASEHVARHRDPLERYAAHLAGRPDPTIINPAKLSPERSSMVCGQCHSVHIVTEFEQWRQTGMTYRPGDDLEETRVIVNPRRNTLDYYVRTYLNPTETMNETTFWRDGGVRITGREYSAMRESKCNINKELSCLTCHSMHHSDPVDQLTQDARGDEACLKCHPAFRDKVAEHTRHTPGTAGASCYNCHMPHTTYGLLKSIRSHLIDSPSVDATLATDRPNACNLCHLDKTLQWTADKLKEWYGQEHTLPIRDELRTTATGPYYALKGDANQRALLAWNLGWPPAHEASGQDWIAPFLIQMMDDPYHAVRNVASRSLLDLKGFERFVYDYAAPLGQIAEEKRQAMDLWRQYNPDIRPRAEVLMRGGGRIDEAGFNRLLSGRDNRPIELLE